MHLHCIAYCMVETATCKYAVPWSMSVDSFPHEVTRLLRPIAALLTHSSKKLRSNIRSCGEKLPLSLTLREMKKQLAFPNPRTKVMVYHATRTEPGTQCCFQYSACELVHLHTLAQHAPAHHLASETLSG
jgi:hypothetical protein